MKKQVLFGLWASLFIVCAGLGFIPEPEGGVRTVLTLSAIFAFVPPAVLIWQACKSGDKNTLSLIRSLSTASLGLTSLLLILNFLSVAWSEAVGNFLYQVLIIVSSPMVCSRHWALSLFLWACLLITSHQQLKKS
jgi:hypothetical protein